MSDETGHCFVPMCTIPFPESPAGKHCCFPVACLRPPFFRVLFKKGGGGPENVLPALFTKVSFCVLGALSLFPVSPVPLLSPPFPVNSKMLAPGGSLDGVCRGADLSKVRLARAACLSRRSAVQQCTFRSSRGCGNSTAPLAHWRCPLGTCRVPRFNLPRTRFPRNRPRTT